MASEKSQRRCRPWSHLKACGSKVMQTGLFLLVASGIVAMLPEEVFNTHRIDVALEATMTSLLSIGVLVQIVKWIISKEKPELFEEAASNQEWKNLVQASRLMTVFGMMASFAVLILCLVTGKSLGTTCYWAALTVISMVTVLIINTTLTAFDRDRANSWKKFCFFLMDHYLLFVFLAAYIHINLLEAKETLEIYEHKSEQELNITERGNTSHNHTGHHADTAEEYYEFLRTASFAIVAELMVMMIVCHEVDGHGQHVHHRRRHQLRPLSWPKAAKVSAAFLGWASATAILCMMVLTLSFGLGNKPLIIFYFKFSSFISFSVYLTAALLLTNAFYEPGGVLRHMIGMSRREISSCLDIVLLRYSLYVLIFFLCLLLVANATGDVVEAAKHPISYLNICSNIVQGWLQYAVLFHFTCIYKDLEMHPDSPERRSIHNQLRWYSLPVCCFNALYWLYNLYQWKGLAMLNLANGGTPGPVWAVLEAVLFPPVVFFRFHSAFICYTIWRQPVYEEHTPTIPHTETVNHVAGGDNQTLIDGRHLASNDVSTEQDVNCANQTMVPSHGHLPILTAYEADTTGCVNGELLRLHLDAPDSAAITRVRRLSY